MARFIARGVCFKRPHGNPELSALLIYEGGRWRLPGGHLETGETSPEAIVREFLEETGLIVEAKGQFFISTTTTKKYEVIKEAFLFVRIVGGEIVQKTTGQGRSPDWFSIERLPRRMAKHYKMLIRKAADRMTSEHSRA